MLVDMKAGCKCSRPFLVQDFSGGEFLATKAESSVKSTSNELKSLGYEVFIALLSILSIVNMGLIWLPGLSDPSKNVVGLFQAAITVIFLADFFYRLTTAESKSHYFFRNWGWADLLASLPNLRILRLFRIFRVYRLMRELGPRTIVDQLVYDRAGSVLYLTIFLGLVIIQTASVLILNLEAANSQANIQTPSDAIWWSYVTVTTVGYGDRFPTTNWGRIVGVLLMTSGVALFGVFTSFLANLFLAPRKKQDERADELPPGSAIAQLHQLQHLMDQQEANMTAVREQISRLEDLLVP
jgi:voltage-gated potassium channel